MYLSVYRDLPQHFLYFIPLPDGHGSFRPTFPLFAFLITSVFILKLSPNDAFNKNFNSSAVGLLSYVVLQLNLLDLLLNLVQCIFLHNQMNS